MNTVQEKKLSLSNNNQFYIKSDHLITKISGSRSSSSFYNEHQIPSVSPSRLLSSSIWRRRSIWLQVYDSQLRAARRIQGGQPSLSTDNRGQCDQLIVSRTPVVFSGPEISLHWPLSHFPFIISRLINTWLAVSIIPWCSIANLDRKLLTSLLG